MNKFKLFIPALWFLLLSTGLWAQSGLCLDFEDLQAGDRYGSSTNFAAGEVFYEKEDIRIALDSFMYPNGSVGFFDLLIEETKDYDPNQQGVSLFPSNVNLQFKLDKLPEGPKKICFDFRYFGGDINFSLNGQQPLVFSSFDEFLRLQSSTFQDIEIEIISPTDNQPAGRLCISGDSIPEILIGGQELLIDNFCVDFQDPNVNCKIQNLVVEPRPCTPNGIFDLDLKFDSPRDSGQYFVLVNNQRFGPFDYPLDSFKTIGPVQTFGDHFFNVTVYDAEQPDCQASTRFEYNCTNFCDIEGLEIEAEICAGDSLARIEIDFDIDIPNIANTTFKLWIDSLEFGEISLLRLPYTLEIPVELLREELTTFNLCVSPNLITGNECCVSGFIKLKKCDDSCPIEDIKAEILSCEGQINYDIYLDVAFEHQYRDYPVAVYVDGLVVDTVRSGSFPVKLAGVPVYTEALTFPVKVCPLWNTGAEDCCKTIYLDKRACDERCPIEGIKAEITQCLPNGNFDIQLYVDYSANKQGSPFKVIVEGEDLGIFEASPEGILLENVPVFTDALDFEVLVCPVSTTMDSLNIPETCCRSIRLSKEDCGNDPPNDNCTYFDDLAPTSFPGADNAPGVEIFNLSNISFRLFELQNLDWSNSYESLSIKSAADLPEFAAAEGQLLYFNAISSIISFSDYEASVNKVNVDFYHSGGHLNISANGSPVQILSVLAPGTYPLGNGVAVEIVLKSNDRQQGSMIFSGNIQALLIGGEALAIDNLCVNREEPPCEIDDLQLEPTECDENGQFYLKLNFRYKNTSDYFIVAGANNTRERFAYKELPVKLGPFSGPINREIVWDVFDAQKEQCVARAAFGPYDCQLPCEITAVETYDVECDPITGLYHFTLEVKGENLGSVLSLSNGKGFIKRFEYSGRAVRIQGVPLPDGRLDRLVLCAGLQPNDAYECCYEFEVAIDCIPECHIKNVEVFDIECLPSGAYSFSLEITGENTEDGIYLLKTRNGYEAKFRLEGNKARIDQVPLPETATGVEFIKLCKLREGTTTDELTGCCYEFEFRVDCRQECGLTNLRLFDFDCHTDSTYSVSLKVEASDYLYGEILYLKTASGFEFRFEYQGEAVRLEGIPKLDNQGQDQIKICAPNYPDCCLESRFEIDCTAEECKIGELYAKTTPCEADGSFFIQLDFRHENTSEGFEVYVNNRPLGGYRYADLPIEVGPIMPDPSTTGRYEVKVKDWERDCFASTEVEACTGPVGCSFASVELISTGCQDGFFEVIAEIELANKKEGEFLVFVEGELFGPYRYSQDQRIGLGPFRGDGRTSYDFLFVDLNDPTCFFFQELGTIDCDEVCEGLAFRAKPLECDSTGQFNILLDVDLDLTVIYPIIIEVNGAFYDSTQIGNPSFEIGPFPADSAYTITIIDGWHPECRSTFDLGLVDCALEEDEVWPGDANRDNIANHLDLLNLGVAWGEDGPQRTLPGSRWTGVPASSWGSRFSDAANSGDFKHADCNGDGIINEEDIAVIRKNYNLRHGKVEDAIVLPATDVDPPVFFEVPESQGLPDSGYFNIPIVLGSEAQPLSDIYGVAFTIEFDPKVINPSDVEISYPTSWLGEPGVNLQSITYRYIGKGKIEIAITRTDQNEVSGYGPVAMFRGIRDDIVGRSESQFDVTHSHAVNTQQGIIRLNGLKKTAKFVPAPTEKEYGFIDLKRGMQVYPNPASSTININNFYGVPIDAVQILTTNGQVMSPRYEGTNTLDVSNLPDGLYLIRVEIDGYFIHQKLFKSKSR
ncbi:MAG TPA: T9SS type A sorting domain-containing protein [Saprospiraceae bacterium]|nr:T9SS type A sorting domain-containing protein [Saprospiraceae bacterium]